MDTIIEKLIKSNCIKIGKFKLKNGKISKYYFDMKNLISFPELLKEIGDKIYEQLGEFDIICGIPYGGLPIATYISTQYNKPMIILRDKVKEYGTNKLIEGEYNINSKCVIIDDVITTGFSMEESIKILKNKVDIVKVYVILDRQQNYKCSMSVNALLYKNDIVKYKLKILYDANRRICFAADIQHQTKLIKTINDLGNKIGICKIHYDIIEKGAIPNELKEELINLSIKYDFLIMEDRKFVDISSIVEKQYEEFNNWVDMVTVHGSVSSETVSKLSGALIVANMSNNTYDLTENAVKLANENKNNVVGYITQNRIDGDFYCMTPGISLEQKKIFDQQYRNIKDVDADFFIVGRALYNSPTININEFIIPR